MSLLDDLCQEREDERATARHALNNAEQKIICLESLRPHWAKGYSSDSMAAQSATNALASIWKILGVTDQTAAIAALKKLIN